MSAYWLINGQSLVSRWSTTGYNPPYVFKSDANSDLWGPFAAAHLLPLVPLVSTTLIYLGFPSLCGCGSVWLTDFHWYFPFPVKPAIINNPGASLPGCVARSLHPI